MENGNDQLPFRRSRITDLAAHRIIGLFEPCPVCPKSGRWARRKRGPRLRRRDLRNRARIVIQNRREPALGLLHAPPLALGVILDLIALDLADAEIVALRMAEIEPAHRRARPHGKAFGEADADALGLE